MKNKFLFILILFSFTILITSDISTIENKNNPLQQNSKPKIFSLSDIKVLGIRLDMSKEKIEKVLGKPIKIKTQYEDAFGGDVLIYYYKFGFIRLEPLGENEYTVSGITIDKPGFKGPRGIMVGDKVEDVIIKFPNNGNLVEDWGNGKRKYLYGTINDNFFGYIEFDKKGEITWIGYNYGGEGFGSYTLRLKIENNKVKSIGIYVMNV